MIDLTESLERIEKALASEYLRSKRFLNVPGASIACKIDPYYYLAVQPLFVKSISLLAAMFPSKVTDVLIKSGNMISETATRNYSLDLRVFWKTPRPGKGNMSASFILADFIEHALSVYAKLDNPVPVSNLKVFKDDYEQVKTFFAGKTIPHSIAFEEYIEPESSPKPRKPETKPWRP